MASELTVQTLKGPTSGANANKIIVPSGHTLAAAGHVLQVQSTFITAGVSTTSASFTDTGLSITITPTSSTSKMLVMFDASCGSSASASGMIVDIVRDTTQLMYTPVAYTNVNESHYVHASAAHLDSPATTSPITYKIRYAAQNAGYTVFFNAPYSGYSNPTANMTVMEIAQ